MSLRFEVLIWIGLDANGFLPSLPDEEVLIDDQSIPNQALDEQSYRAYGFDVVIPVLLENCCRRMSLRHWKSVGSSFSSFLAVVKPFWPALPYLVLLGILLDEVF